MDVNSPPPVSPIKDQSRREPAIAKSVTGETMAKPVIAINTATYWHALRQNGITEKVQGFGRLLEEF
jgi:maleate cis-trans isomerase